MIPVGKLLRSGGVMVTVPPDWAYANRGRNWVASRQRIVRAICNALNFNRMNQILAQAAPPESKASREAVKGAAESV